MKWAAGTMCTIQVDDFHGYSIFGLSMFLVYVNMVKFVFGPPFIFIVFWHGVSLAIRGVCVAKL